ncbi:AMP-binding protein [Streptomyces hyaluromycini]|uniref:AMP-binding protein n=1 Tax=Streptomyces hyaluromycini TaxID=1377993 RepID=A0ABV1WRF0_9ACTN
MPSPNVLSHLFEHAGRAPERTALEWRDAATSYRELSQLVNAAGVALQKRFSAADGLVCIPAVKTPQTIALILAAHAHGLTTLVPSADLGREALLNLARDAGASDVVRAGQSAGDVVFEAVPHAAGRCSPSSDRSRVDAASLVLTTSGTTGSPKAVPIPHEAVDRFTLWVRSTFGVRPGTQVLNYAPLNFDLTLLDVWATLSAGATALLVDPDRATDGRYLADLAGRADVIQGVPLLYRLVTAAVSTPFPTAHRHLIFTGDVTTPRLASQVAEMFPGASLHNVYGCTETNDSFHHLVSQTDLTSGMPLPVGRPLPGVDAVVLGHDGAVIETEGRGELLVRTPFQTSGYLNPAQDAGRFVRVGSVAAAGACHDDSSPPYYRTGDVVRRLNDGTVVLEGRNAFHVKVRGVRTNLQEIEQVLLQHPDVADAVVVAVPDDLAGHHLHATVRRSQGTDLNSLRLRGYCADRLPRTAIPKRFKITDHPLPSTPTGKVDRPAIRAQLEEEATHVHL